MLNKRYLIIFCCLLFIGRNSLAVDNILTAETEIKNGADISNYEQYASHPLYPYLQYRYYSDNLSTVNTPEIVDFLLSNPNAPYSQWLANKIYPQWLSNGQYEAIINSYSSSFKNDKIECVWRLANMQLGHKKQAESNIKKLWLTDRNIDSACDPLFTIMLSDGSLSQSLLSERFKLAMRANNSALANYLSGLLTGAEHQYAITWLNLKSTVTTETAINLITDPAWKSAATSDLIKQLAQTDINQAVTLSQQLKAVFNAYPEDAADAFNDLASKLARDDNSQTASIFRLIPKDYHHKNQTLDVIAYYLRINDWQTLNDLLNNYLSDNEKNNAEYLYWLAKSYEKLGDTQTANLIYQKAAIKRDFFAFLAAEKLSLAYHFNDQPIRKDSAIYQSVMRHPEIYRIRTFLALNQPTRAGLELNALKKQLNEEQINQLALFTDQHNWAIQSVVLVSQLKNWNALTVRFPIQYPQMVKNAATQTGLSPATIYAIIRKESTFQPTIRSAVGAIGLMQVMPATGRHTANKYGLTYAGTATLYQASNNILIGAHYLNDQIQDFGNLAVAAAAYNAGPHRASRWLADNPDLPLDEWIAQIPFYETRDYVKRVLEYEKVYEYRLGLPPQRFSSNYSRPW